MKKVLLIVRDGTLVVEPPLDFQLDSLDKLVFFPGVFQNLARIAQELDYKLVMVTNQDGLGTALFPEENFWPVHNLVMKAFENEGVVFSEVLIDKTFPYENAPTRKPAIGLLTKYINNPAYDLENSFLKLKNHKIVSEDVFIKDEIRLKYPNFYYTFSNGFGYENK